MNCLDPQRAWQTKATFNGRRKPTFKRSEAYTDLKMEIPCGKCYLCRDRKVLDIATRVMHEASMHEQSCVITPTYSDENLPSDGKLRPNDWSIFMKRLRRRVNHTIRALTIGEYGSRTHRPHLHSLIFGVDLLGAATPINPGSQSPQYMSTLVDDLWGLGHVRIGTITPASASYVASYAIKGLGENKPGFKETYSYPKRPALGRMWYERNLEQLARLGHCILNGAVVPIPEKYFTWDAEEENVLQIWKDKRIEFAENAAIGISADTRRYHAESRAANKMAKRGLKKTGSI